MINLGNFELALVKFWGLLSLLFLIVIFMIWGSRLWAPPESNGQLMSRQRQEQELQIISEDCTTKKVCVAACLLNFCIECMYLLLFIAIESVESLRK